MVKVIQLLVFLIFFNGVSQKLFISKNTCFKEITFDTDVEQLTGFSEPNEAADRSFLAYFEFLKIIDAHSNMVSTEALISYLKGEFYRLLGEVQIIEPSIENEIDSNILRCEKDDIFYELRTGESIGNEDINDFEAIHIYIGIVESLQRPLITNKDKNRINSISYVL